MRKRALSPTILRAPKVMMQIHVVDVIDAAAAEVADDASHKVTI